MTSTESRIVLHWAAQVVSAAGSTLLPAREDYSHQTLQWDAAQAALVGEPVAGAARATTARGTTVSAALVPAALTIRVGDRALPLAGRTMAEALDWLASAMAEATGAQRKPLVLPGFELPAHAVGTGGTFPADGEAERAALGQTFAAADVALRALAAKTPEASQVRVWPHHFDIATLLTLESGGRTVGAGMSPGDGSYADPYYYVTPWPYPKAPSPPALPAGASWHTAGWFGAVLPAAARAGQVTEFLDVAVAACRALAGS